MMMRSGTDWKGIYTPGSELDKHRDLLLNEAKAYYEDYAYKAKAAIPPGTRFNYSTLDTCIVGWALERAVRRPLAAYMSEKLWQPAGMETDAYWVQQGKPQEPRIFYGAGLSASLREVGQVTLGQPLLQRLRQ